MPEKLIAKARRKRIAEKKKVFGVEVREHPESSEETPAPEAGKQAHPRLGQWYATAICGNDITSSCLYVAAIATRFAGRLAPFCLLLVAGLLYLFRKIYSEVVGALPLNGGAYNALLNSTTKFKASLAACMTILSYMATAVISAKTAVAYVDSLVSVPVLPVTVAVLAVFMVLSIIGITESARAAMVIFVIHLSSLVLLCVLGGIYWMQHPDIFAANWQAPLPGGRGVALALFFGFSAGLLGISGFESSANFVEEQAPGVFPKTLRNMWVAVTIFNPLIALLALGMLPLPAITDEANQDFLLAIMGHTSGGMWLQTVVAVDAALVLCGAVLTSFVGVGGLVRRMTLDRCLPQFLLKENRRGTTHRIFILFFLLCTSIVLLTGGDLLSLAGVYTISFLGVMALFVVGNILLKVRRAKLPRPVRAGWPSVLLALVLTLTGLVGNVLIDRRNLNFFLTYFVPTVLVVGLMFLRLHILKLALVMLRGLAERVGRFHERMSRRIMAKMDEINSQGIIFFTRGDSLAMLNAAMLYVRQNETTKRVRVVHVYKKREDVPKRLERDLKFLDEVYPEIKIELVLVKGEFNPATIERISRQYGVPQNYMFIGAPGDKFPHNIEDLGGVRIILS
ncbi:MAG: APC family permease [Deltaproteobacteria bacterium]|nr:MAG: APC family permease [Deltaproteobacteria bacterium]